MNEWHIQSRSHVCQACGKSFSHKQPYHTLLFEEKEEYRRQDVCAPCWTERSQAPASRRGMISCWQGVYEEPPAAPPDPIQKETAETLLRKLIEPGAPEHAAACFILAVMLERKRLLKVKEQFHRDGARVFIYEQPGTGDLFTIRDPQLRLDQLEEVQRDVARLLEHGLPRPPAETQPAAATADVPAAPDAAGTEINPPPDGEAAPAVPSPNP